MSSVGRELGVSAFAVKEACDQVGIDCTVVTFDSDSQELWRAIDRNVEPVALKPGGGTNPTGAFNVLDSHREEQKYHLVIILTDGVWNGDVKCHDYASDGRVFLGVAFGAEVDTAYLLRVGCDQVVNIDAIEQLPEVVRNFLLNFLG
jgi:predicted metal-dependent peptidase